MSSFPPPDLSYEVPQPVRVEDVFITIVGIIHSEPDVEVLARSGDDFYRFCLPKTSRVVRDFWKNIGVTNVSKLPDGAYQDERGGCGPYAMSGIIVGEDAPVEEEEVPVEEVPFVIEEADTPLDIADHMPPQPGRLDNLFALLSDVPPQVEYPVVSLGTKVLFSVRMESTSPEPSGLVLVEGAAPSTWKV